MNGFSDEEFDSEYLVNLPEDKVLHKLGIKQFFNGTRASIMNGTDFLQCRANDIKQLDSNIKRSGDSVIVTKQKRLYLIGINRPEKRNAINDETAALLNDAFDKFENDDEAYAAVLFGKGGNFCSGYDLSHVAKGNFYGITSNQGPIGPLRRLLKKPVVASISGYAVAGGFEMALWCDLRVVEETAVMGFFNRRFGLPLLNGSTARLPQLIGLSRALDLILTGRPVHAKEALEMGIASRITACGTGLGNAINLANSLCKFPQESLRTDRLSAYRSTYDMHSLDEALKLEFENASK
ncbi:Mevalonyl-coenzyme A hydratase sidH like protein [Argiope bruennichi]|uniref:Mevalonyl-coenzyme A hydratase sidH like protein n=1 Tax=Argiope bruennichi TaxID=94029 RepID=A0A8T0FEG4_ARGBR|nr:Mevalonyl-coenzyme A hydratase sidH like protein [Argiope bruennichi]